MLGIKTWAVNSGLQYESGAILAALPT